MERMNRFFGLENSSPASPQHNPDVAFLSHCNIAAYVSRYLYRYCPNRGRD